MYLNSTRSDDSVKPKQFYALPIQDANHAAIIVISIGCSLTLLLVFVVIIFHIIRLRNRIKARRSQGESEKGQETHRNFNFRHRFTASDMAAMLPLLKVPPSPMQAHSRSPNSASPYSGYNEPDSDAFDACLVSGREPQSRTLRTSHGFAVFTDETPQSPAITPPPLPPKSPRYIFATFFRGQQVAVPTEPPTPPPKDSKMDVTMGVNKVSDASSRTSNPSQMLPRIVIPPNSPGGTRVHKECPPVHVISVPSPVSSDVELSPQSGIYFELSADTSAPSSFSHLDGDGDIMLLLSASVEGTGAENENQRAMKKKADNARLETPPSRLTRSISQPSMHLTVPSAHAVPPVPIPRAAMVSPSRARPPSPVGPRPQRPLFRSTSLFALNQQKDGDHKHSHAAESPDMLMHAQHLAAEKGPRRSPAAGTLNVMPPIVLHVAGRKDRLNQYGAYDRPLPQTPENSGSASTVRF